MGEWNSFSKTPHVDPIILTDTSHTRRAFSYGYPAPNPEEGFNAEPSSEELDRLRAEGYVYWKYV